MLGSNLIINLFYFQLIMKPLSGAAKRKRAKEKEKLIDLQRGSIHKFLKSNTSTSKNPYELTLVLVGE